MLSRVPPAITIPVIVEVPAKPPIAPIESATRRLMVAERMPASSVWVGRTVYREASPVSARAVETPSGRRVLSGVRMCGSDSIRSFDRFRSYDGL